MAEKPEISGTGLNRLHELLVRAAELAWGGRAPDDPRTEWVWTLEKADMPGATYTLNLAYDPDAFNRYLSQAAQELGLLPAPCGQSTGMTAKEALARLQELESTLRRDALPGTHGSTEVLEEHRAKLEAIKAAAQEFSELAACLERRGLLRVVELDNEHWGLFVSVIGGAAEARTGTSATATASAGRSGSASATMQRSTTCFQSSRSSAMSALRRLSRS